MNDPVKVLTIAGTDSGGGAGVQADLKTITALGGYGMSVICALTAQNTVGVQAIHDVPLDFIEAQFDSVMKDIGADGAKTGMLASSVVVRTVVKKVKEYKIERLVVDPVMVAKSGDPLLSEDGIKAVSEEMIPLAMVVTPNIPEAEVLSGIKIEGVDSMKRAAEIIAGLGARNVVVKGGHLEGEAVDVLFNGAEFTLFPKERVETKNTHGTGCTFSAAIATGLASGMDVSSAVKQAELYIDTAIRFSLNVGRGHGPTNHMAWFLRDSERYGVIEELKRGAGTLVQKNIAPLIPEVQSNLGYALPYAVKHDHVAAFPARIIKAGGGVLVPVSPEFGASIHIANIILTAMRYDPGLRSAMNIRFGEDLIKKANDRGLAVASFSRADEPEDVKDAEGSSLAWGVSKVLSETGGTPDLIYDRGDVGKEPMIRVLGKNPGDVVGKVLGLLD
ncbi:MAG: bifunctional hydroxymethylpyrimidine kinase/phosphomethylpyrimidine kinase [Deltaproteobacteria bacterium]|uniref:hydroxymethylpyrimidine kinase n=1 Tax=Candidatus Zymogenus saltonus TaxID=2844893 RepID=A0A9D8PPI5_9DELT|nr:bifunctional hydroxymethylpyrimidine kinase/phosphomethylpyrimidine kinase [Candidatus Zymogenus saltonus]